MAYNYPYGNGQQLNLDWFLAEWKNLLAAWEAEKNGIDGALQAEIDRAEAALADVFAARDAAAQSAANALESKNAAAQSASDASGYLDSVEQNATAARNAAQNAAQSESNAAESAQTALASKNNAAQSERNAAQSEANALASKNAAAQSANDADASKSAAAQSAEDALANKNAAAQSAEDAEDAAASVEASTQQIATNTGDISNLKNSVNNKLLELLPIPILNYNMLKDGDASYTPNVLTVTCFGNIYKLTNPIEYPHKLENVVNACNIGRITTGGSPLIDQALIESGFSIKITVLKGNITATDLTGLRIAVRYSDDTSAAILADRQEIKSGDVLYYDVPNKNLKWAYTISVGPTATINSETWLLVELVSTSNRANTLAMILEN